MIKFVSVCFEIKSNRPYDSGQIVHHFSSIMLHELGTSGKMNHAIRINYMSYFTVILGYNASQIPKVSLGSTFIQQ